MQDFAPYSRRRVFGCYFSQHRVVRRGAEHRGPSASLIYRHSPFWQDAIFVCPRAFRAQPDSGAGKTKASLFRRRLASFCGPDGKHEARGVAYIRVAAMKNPLSLYSGRALVAGGWAADCVSFGKCGAPNTKEAEEEEE